MFKKLNLLVVCILFVTLTGCGHGYEKANAPAVCPVQKMPESITAIAPPGQTAPKAAANESQDISRQKKWEEVSRAYRVQGEIESVVAPEGKVKSIALQVTGNMFMENNPVSYDFVGKKLQIYFEDAEMDKSEIARLKKGRNIVIDFAQYALPDGKVVFGAVPDCIYIVVDGGYEDIHGNKQDKKFQPESAVAK